MTSPDPERVIAALAATFSAWAEPDSPWRARLARELRCYSPEVLDHALREGLRCWTDHALRDIRCCELAGGERRPGRVAVWLAASVPAGVFSALALPLLAGAEVWAKPSSADPASPALFAESLRAIDSELAAALHIGAPTEILDTADAIVAYGSDETIEILRARAGPRTFVAHGHKLSLAAIGPHADLERAAARAALDAALYDGRGCLSPALILVDDRAGGRVVDFAAALSHALEELAGTLPRGSLQPGEELRLRELRARVAMSGAQTWLSRDSTGHGVWLCAAGERPEPGLLRHLPVVPIAGLAGLFDACGALAPHLSSLGVIGFGAASGALDSAALAGGGSRVCALGRMQLPPIGWRHDGMGAIEPLFGSPGLAS